MLLWVKGNAIKHQSVQVKNDGWLYVLLVRGNKREADKANRLRQTCCPSVGTEPSFRSHRLQCASPSTPSARFLPFNLQHFLFVEKKMSCAESSDGERTVSPTAAATVRERRRLRLLKRRWNQRAIANNNSSSQHNGGMVLSFSAFRRARRMRHQRRMTKEEYLRLKNMVPAVATQSRVSKVRKRNLIMFAYFD